MFLHLSFNVGLGSFLVCSCVFVQASTPPHLERISYILWHEGCPLCLFALHPSTDSLPGKVPLVRHKKSRYCSLSRFWFLRRDMLNNWRNFGLPFACHLKTLPSWPLNSTGIQYVYTHALKICVLPFIKKSAISPAWWPIAEGPTRSPWS